MEKKIIQISDVHFGALTFSKELKSSLILQIQYENPDFIIFAGMQQIMVMKMNIMALQYL
ncbi:metallophosphoesterase [Methanobacterium sp.]|uniref:metallophosphoesterase n=1 Tax=Methanobacterium sp. TaxID=2164 RepID=UPI00315850F2